MNFGAAAGVALAEVDEHVVARALAGEGLNFDLGAASVRVRSDCRALAGQLRCSYAHFPFAAGSAWADVHVRLHRARGLRRWVRPTVDLVCDGQVPFSPFPDDSPLPLFEWGCNGLIGRRMHHVLLLHAGAVERDGVALVMPALPGSGKSTLTAALSQRGWRLLSDEFGAFDPANGVFRPLLKPIALKNESIRVMREFAPAGVFGPDFRKTRKGTVAHLAATAESVARRHEPARPGAFLLPRWSAGSPTRLEPLAENRLFTALAFNAFNYTLLGAVGFEAVVKLARQCPSWRLEYSDLDDALVAIDRVWSEWIARRAEEPATA